jgi:phenylalanyl-tRNA synthetase alpha chain
MYHLTELGSQAKEAIQAANDISALEAIRITYLGKKGLLTEILKNLATLSLEEKPVLGQQINVVKKDILSQIETKILLLKEEQLCLQLQAEAIDVTLPGRQEKIGSLHPITLVKNRINDFFVRYGFDVITGPEIETEYYNFEALNIPSHHPARAMHDTFYFPDRRLLRTHTSPVQIRAMEVKEAPLRFIAPGRVYRCDSDLTHTPMFHQVEGLMVDRGVTMTQLRGILSAFFAFFFHKPIGLRFRPSYFPFTEPSAEVDIECTQCQGKGCRVCKWTGWLEVAGCGMLHPYVLKTVNITPGEFQGWAFGMGIDRLAMLYYGIDDLRLMFENDLAFLQQF